MEELTKAKAALTLLFAGLSAILGWFGWLIVAFIACLLLDYITGTIAAGKLGQWHSQAAREGIWHKVGSIIAVVVASIADSVFGLIVNNIPGISLPFEYTVMLSPIVLVWYIFTELGSVTENAQKLGAPLPPFLQKVLAASKNSTEKAGGRFTDQ